MKPVFIVGTGRCGSSLINEILARHKDVAFISNIDDILSPMNLKGRWNNSIFSTPIGNLTKKGRPRFAPSEGYRLISRRASPVYANSSRDLKAADVSPWLSRRFHSFFEERNEAQNKAVFLHKYTGWSRLGFFAQIFPQAKFINIIRDGRAVANSWLQMPWWHGYRGPENWLWGQLPEAYQHEWLDSGQSFVRLAGISWKILMDSFEQGQAEVNPDHYLELRYEDFLDKPDESLASLLEFADLPWTDDFENQLSRQHLHSNRKQAYLRDLSQEQVHELEISLGEKLEKYGYSRVGTS